MDTAILTLIATGVIISTSISTFSQEIKRAAIARKEAREAEKYFREKKNLVN